MIKVSKQPKTFGFQSATLLALIMMPLGCQKEGDSSAQTYTNAELRNNLENVQEKAKKAAANLKKAGWCEIPADYLTVQPMSKKSSKRKFSHNEIVQYMGCVANKESTMGKNKVNHDSDEGDGMGKAIGLWQVKEGHIGKKLTMGSRDLVCGENLEDDQNSATCALIAFVEAAKNREMEYNGLHPWEAVCSESDYKIKNNSGQPIFIGNCDDCEANFKPKTSLSEDGSKWIVEASVPIANCGATQMTVELVDTGSGKPTNIAAESAKLENSSNGTKVGSISFEVALFPTADVARIKILNGAEVLFVTNPSPKLPAPRVATGVGATAGAAASNLIAPKLKSGSEVPAPK